MPIVEIADPSDRRCDRFRRLKDAEQRRLGFFIAESELVVRRLLDEGHEAEELLVTASRSQRMESQSAELAATSVYVVTSSVLDEIIGFPMHREVVALFRRPEQRDPAELVAKCDRLVVLDDVVDPDNVGAVFRHCAAFGADGVLLSGSAGDPLYRKAVRSSMAWSLAVPFARTDDVIGVLAGEPGLTTVALTPSGEVDLRRLAATFRASGGPLRLAVLLGSEHLGLSPETIEASTYATRIDMAPHVDSLNVATSAAIAMYELFGAA